MIQQYLYLHLTVQNNLSVIRNVYPVDRFYPTPPTWRDGGPLHCYRLIQ
jgi:hypothetical protein